MKEKAFNQVDVFGLFDALYKNGNAKLSDHFINDDDENGNDVENDK